MFQTFLLIVTHIELLCTILLFAVVIQLFLLQSCNHAINHFDDLIEADLLAFDSQRNEVKLGSRDFACLLCLSHGSQSELARSAAAAHLDKACTSRSRQCLLKQLQSVIIVENSDSICDSKQFFVASANNFLPFCGFCGTGFAQISQEGLVFKKCFFGIAEIVLHLYNLNRELANA